jgi:phospholipid/cholesterol/gamma-HCH transport system ATP-binding protein
MIELKDVRKSYGESTVLDGISFRAPRNRITSIVGASGEGKSTLLRLILGLEEPDRGTVLVDGEKVGPVSDSESRRTRAKIGMVFQEHSLVEYLTVRENLALPIKHNMNLSESEIKDIVLEKLADVGLLGYEDKTPRELTFGALKRAGLARALVLEPELVLVDEPSSGLDPTSGTFLFNLIVKTHLERSVTYLLVTHNARSVMEISHEIMLLFKGNIVAQGSPDEITDDPDHLIHRMLTGSLGGKISTV